MIPLIVRVLLNVYTYSDMNVIHVYGSETSQLFMLQNGVKQGPCLSPI